LISPNSNSTVDIKLKNRKKFNQSSQLQNRQGSQTITNYTNDRKTLTSELTNYRLAPHKNNEV